MNKKVAVLRCEEYCCDTILEKMREAWSLTHEAQVAGGKDNFPDVRNKRVLLKPNVLQDAPPDKAISTHPEFLRAAIRLMKELGAAEIIAGDSPLFQKPGFSGRICGLGDVCIEEGIEWYDFSSGTTIINCPEGKMVNQFMVSDIVNRIDMIISLPKLKTHQLMLFTGAIKNQFGLIPGMSKTPYHMLFPAQKNFAQMLVDLHITLNPVYAFMDGIISMEGPGPANGIPIKSGLILASSNLLALDITASRLIGYDPDRIPVNRIALDSGRWLKSSSETEICGMKFDEARIHQFNKIKLTGSRIQLLDFLTPKIIKSLQTRLSPKPVFRSGKCTQCGECVRICPAEALEIADTAINIDYDKCIRCFCCHEACPFDAIAIKRSWNKKGLIP
ncbi:MAG: DUF362 domain-containing protein [Spirochaetales bacterium]|uniref:DUF362 domain-containing protein n=1 Tax=Candidatus Thalassospirochaeta sargassi TaxID=3119039 RepID=A0AAJ1MIR4_9SPIO|nr:DUF362 domain-containing protein [Spirochaetales bacterium]